LNEQVDDRPVGGLEPAPLAVGESLLGDLKGPQFEERLLGAPELFFEPGAQGAQRRGVGGGRSQDDKRVLKQGSAFAG
jgi:hypothetical protein